MISQPTYTELAVTLANYIHKYFYKVVKRQNLPPVRLFDDGCQSNLQLARGVLTRLGLLVPHDGGFRFHEFAHEPEQFDATITKYADQGCDYDAVVLALIWLANSFRDDSAELFSVLVMLDICEFDYEHVHKEIDIGLVKDRNIWKAYNDHGIKTMVPRIKWTKKKDYYDELGRNWVKLID